MDYEKEVVNAKLTYLDPKVSTDPNAGYTTFSLEGVDYYPQIDSDKELYAYSLSNGLDYAPLRMYLVSNSIIVSTWITRKRLLMPSWPT